MAENYRFIGKDTPRKDAREIVTGRANYIDDIKLPHMLHGRVLRSPYAHANIKHVDTSRARALPGVRAMLTYKDVPDWEWGMPKHMRVLDSKVRYVGDAVTLAALDATLKIIGPKGMRMVPVTEFYHPIANAIEKDEMIT